ncbi:MAG TPA: hypothetical protein V6C96_01465, partial [Vampirovibrionales bacterium]
SVNNSWGQKVNKEEVQKSEFEQVPNSSSPYASSSSRNGPTFGETDNYNLKIKQDRLSQCLSQRNIILYGVTTTTKPRDVQFQATQQQLLELGDASKQIKVVDCSPSQAECSGILVYPTWILDNQKELAGVYELNDLAQILGCQIN